MTRNKILFINPPQSFKKAKAGYVRLKFPLGFLYMAGHLEKNDFKVKIVDSPLHYNKIRPVNKETVKIGLLPNEIKEIIKNYNPDIIGVSCAYSAYEGDSFEVIDIIHKTEKEMNKKFLIVVGGAHTSANTEYVLRNDKINLAVIGEGEETILEIAKKYSQKKDIKNIKGTALKINGKIKINKPRPYVENLDDLKPAWHLINMKMYFNHPDNSRVTLRKNSIDLVTSRGCPGMCRFCSIHTVWGRKWRGRSAKNVVDEIEYLMKKYDMRYFRVQDDNLTLNKKRIIEICDEIVRRKLDVKWDTPNGVAFWTLDEEVLNKMSKAGCHRTTFGIESGCEKTQKYIRKRVDMKKIRQLIKICHKLRIWICSTFIIGFPYETKEDLEEAKKIIVDSNLNFAFIYVAQPYPGTDMFEDFKKENLLKEIKSTSSVLISQYNTLHFTNSQLNKIRNKIITKFYLRRILAYTNPVTFYKEFLSKIKNFEDLKYVTKNLANTIISF